MGYIYLQTQINERTENIAELETQYDLILLDVMLPGMSGFSLLRELRKQKDTPVIMITAKVREEDRLRGYELGCDDYVCKPFLMSELYAKVGAILRRAKGNCVTGRRLSQSA